MNVRDAYRFYIIKSIEEHDSNNEYFTFYDRQQASKDAVRNIDQKKIFKKANGNILSNEQKKYLKKRSKYLYKKLPYDLKEESNFNNSNKFYAVLFLYFLSFIFGYFFQNFTSHEKVINILSLPLIFLLVWNVLVYIYFLLKLINSFFRKKDYLVSSDHNLMEYLIQKFLIKNSLSDVKSNKKKSDNTSSEDIKLFSAIRSEQALFFKKLKSIHLWSGTALVNLMAVFFALGSIISLLMLAWQTEFKMTWESTIITSKEQLGTFLNIVLSPGGLIGFPPPTHLLGDINVEITALPWIKSYISTLVVIIIIPRMFISGISYLKVRHLRENFFINTIGCSSYVDNCFKYLSGDKKVIFVLPYNLTINSEKKVRLLELVLKVYGGSSQINILDKIDYGNEDENYFLNDYGENDSQKKLPKELILIFNFNTTPEQEMQALLVESIIEKYNKNRSTLKLIIVLDTSTFEEKFKKTQNLEKNYSNRLEAWKNLFKHFEIATIQYNLLNSNDIMPDDGEDSKKKIWTIN